MARLARIRARGGGTSKMNDGKSGLCGAFAVGAAMLAWSGTTNAQVRATPGASLNRYEPAETGSDWFTGESLDLRGTARPALGVVGDYAYKSYVLKNPDGTENTVIVGNRTKVTLRAQPTRRVTTTRP